MNIRNSWPHYRIIPRSLLVLAVLTSLFSIATAEPFSLAGFPQPEQIKGVVFIDSVKEGSLLQLKGMAGKGVLVVPVKEASRCASLSLRFVAGDFDGSSIGIHAAEPIRLVIYSERVTTALAAGHDIVSEDYNVTTQSDNTLGDIKVSASPDSKFGFVLNLGKWPWSGLFGNRTKPVECDWPEIIDRDAVEETQ